MKKLIITLLLFVAVVGDIAAQDTQERNWLIRHAAESAVRWSEERAYAESVAIASGFPIRVTLVDGPTIELQKIENGMPMYYMSQNINAARTISTNRVWPGGSGGFSLTGNGDTLGIWDEGRVRLEHQEFATGRVNQVDGASTNSNHATHVAGTMVAGGTQANAKGMSYEALLRAWDWNNDQSEMTNAALNGLRVSNHSYGFITGWRENYFKDDRWAWFGDTTISNTKDYRFGFYSSTARDWDNIARNAPHYLIVKSAGNDRLEGPTSQPIQHWVFINGSWVLRTVTRDLDGGPSGYDCLSHASVSKNVLTVGAVNDIPNGYTQPNDVVISSFSSWGPTDDGRIKPDVVANGVNLYSPIASSNTAYDDNSGTSMAAPNVSGSLGLLLQYHKSLYENNPMRASTMKAIVIHTADEAGTNTGPDYVFGWGLMNTLNAVNLMKLNYERGGSHIYERVLNQGQVVEIQIRATGSEPLRVTICWTDPAGTPPAPSLDPTNLMLVNDLDLRLVSQGGTTYYPYILNPSNPSAGATTGDNTRDNVEQIHLQNPSAGLYTIRVTHKGTISGGSQLVSVVVSGTDNILVTVDQRLHGGGSIDSVGRWEGGPNFVTFAVPRNFSFTEGSQEILRGAQKIISNQKYHRWNEIFNNVLNHRSFPIQKGMDPLTSNLYPTHSGVTIKNSLEETNIAGGTLFFYDPWLIDYPDPQFGNTLRNRGMDAPPKQRSSPFYPDYTTNYNGDVYKGVFLNQEISSGTYYNVWAGDQQINLGSPLGVRQFYFQNWSANGANLLPFGAGNQSRVVFTSGDAVVQANLKGTQLSGSTNGFSNSSQRKFIATLFPQYYYHLVYSSGGSVWYEKAHINSEVVQPLNWQLMNNAKPLNGDFFYTEGKSPSIDYCYATHGGTEENFFIFIVYQKKKTDNKYEIRLSKFNQSGVKIFDIQVFSSEHTDYSTIDCMPVVGVSRQKDDLAPIKVVVLWKRPAEGSAPAGLYYVAGFDQGTSINWTDSYPTPHQISTTDANSINPSLSVFKSPYGNISYHLAYQQGTSQIKYTDIEFGVNGSNAETPIVISTGSGSSTNITPSITVNNTRYTYPILERVYDSPKIVWGTGYEGCGVYRSKPNKSSNWSPFYVYIENDDVQSPTISGPKYHPSGTDDVFHFGWSWLVGYYKSYVSTSNLAIKRSLPYSGNDIQIANNLGEWDGFGYCVLSNFYGTPAPFTFQNKWVDEGLFKPGANIQAGRAGTIIKDEAEFYFALGDIRLNDSEIDFVTFNDTMAIFSLNDLNSALITKPFDVNDNSLINYSIYYGFNDTVLAYNSLSENDQIYFKVEIIDEQTQQVLGIHHNIAQSKEDLKALENTSYQVNMQGIGNREIRLRLTAGNNFTSDYSLSKIYSFNQNLGKENISTLKWNGLEVITEYALDQNFPNPFNPSTTIRYQLPQDGMVTLKVYDILGSELATLVNEQRSAGRYEVNFDASRLASGVYIYKITSGSYVSSKKMLLVK